MSYEEKGTWVYLVTSAGAYAVYLAIILGRVASTPVATRNPSSRLKLLATARLGMFRCTPPLEIRHLL